LLSDRLKAKTHTTNKPTGGVKKAMDPQSPENHETSPVCMNAHNAWAVHNAWAIPHKKISGTTPDRLVGGGSECDRIACGSLAFFSTKNSILFCSCQKNTNSSLRGKRGETSGAFAQEIPILTALPGTPGKRVFEKPLKRPAVSRSNGILGGSDSSGMGTKYAIWDATLRDYATICNRMRC